ncbi:MAG: hypothetical protein NZ733_00155, partial [Aigarchaeota archaeon]|nr:hypothetical protein [Aigarchaeota archaeon]
RSGAGWSRVTSRVVSLSHEVRGNQLESLEITLLDEDAAVGHQVRYLQGGVPRFEGFVVNVRRSASSKSGRLTVCQALSELVLWDRHVVFREYAAGTRAGAIVKDLARLESGVDVANVDESDTPALLAPWAIQNESALKVMTAVSRGTNYYLRMKPGRKLYFKPKAPGAPVATIDSRVVTATEYSEDRWRLRDRVIVVGAGGQVMADVSEGGGELPVVVHDPFLTSTAEAQRRARIRLALNREYGRQLRLTVRRDFVERSQIDLFSMVRIDLPELGLSGVDMHVVGIRYAPPDPHVVLEVGGRLELLEDYLSEAIGGDVTARFGKAIGTDELASMRSTLYHTQRVVAAVGYRFVTYVNKRPITFHRGANVRLNDVTGEVELASGSINGWFEVDFVPPSELFACWCYASWVSYPGDGEVVVELKNASGEVLRSLRDLRLPGWALAKRAYLRRWPGRVHTMTRHPAFSLWGSSQGARVIGARMGYLVGSCVRLEPLSYGTPGEIFYPASRDLNLEAGWVRRMNFYLCPLDDGVTCRVRLYHDASNYREVSVVAQRANEWTMYSVNVGTMTVVGNPTRVNWIGFSSAYPLLIDSDYVLHELGRERLTVRFNLSRPSATSTSPRISLLTVTYEERAA